MGSQGCVSREGEPECPYYTNSRDNPEVWSWSTCKDNCPVAGECEGGGSGVHHRRKTNARWRSVCISMGVGVTAGKGQCGGVVNMPAG